MFLPEVFQNVHDLPMNRVFGGERNGLGRIVAYLNRSIPSKEFTRYDLEI